MKVKTLKVNITPSVGVELCGFANRIQPSTHILDQLFCKILFLGERDSLFVLMQFDLIGFDPGFCTGFRERLSTFFALPISHIQVFASHTHSGPCSLHLNACGAYDPEYLVFLEGLIFNKLIREREQSQAEKECSVTWYESSAKLGQNRRGRVDSENSNNLGILALRDGNGDYSALLINYPMHPVCLKGQGISADYPGQIACLLGEELPGNPIVLFGLGPCGDIDPPAVGVSYKTMVEWGHQIAKPVIQLLGSDSTTGSNPVPEFKQDILTWPLEVLTEEEIDNQADKFLMDQSGLEEFGVNYHLAIESWRANRKANLHAGAASEVQLTIDRIRLGTLNLVFLNAEVFSAISELIKSNHSDKYWLISCANGLVGYLPDLQQYNLGGYESEISHVFYDSLRITSGALECLSREVLNY